MIFIFIGINLETLRNIQLCFGDGKLWESVHHTTIPSRISIKFGVGMECNLVTKYYDFYLYWNRFGDVMGVGIRLVFLFVFRARAMLGLSGQINLTVARTGRGL